MIIAPKYVAVNLWNYLRLPSVLRRDKSFGLDRLKNRRSVCRFLKWHGECDSQLPIISFEKQLAGNAARAPARKNRFSLLRVEKTE